MKPSNPLKTLTVCIWILISLCPSALGRSNDGIETPTSSDDTSTNQGHFRQDARPVVEHVLQVKNVTSSPAEPITPPFPTTTPILSNTTAISTTTTTPKKLLLALGAVFQLLYNNINFVSKFVVSIQIQIPIPTTTTPIPNTTTPITTTTTPITSTTPIPFWNEEKNPYLLVHC
uniref:Uncharacterized protein n=1 Tax=Cacopsylla melanoneura TaxID=428564 RepID=A0A8D8VBN3_9HEMI